MSAKPVWLASVLLVGSTLCLAQDGGAASEQESKPPADAKKAPAQTSFSGRFTSQALSSLLESRVELLPLPLQLEAERNSAIDAVEQVDFGAILEAMTGHLAGTYGDRFDPAASAIVAPVPISKQVTIDLSDVGLDPYTGPSQEVVGFVIHRMSQDEYLSTAFQVIETSRMLLATGDPAVDLHHPDHYRKLAEARANQLRAAQQAQESAARQREETRKRIGQLLGIYHPQTDTFEGQPNWIHESRRFSYVINEETGKFIERLQPVVEQINHDLVAAGFSPGPDMGTPGIHFDPDLGDVEIVLPKPMMLSFLEETDSLEQRMAEKLIISIEAVRLTDRDIVTGAVAARLNAQVRGVHDVERFNTDGVIRQLGINSLLAVANQQLQVRTLNAVAAGGFPAGVAPIQIAAPQLPPVRTIPISTTVGSNFSVGADDIFFDGRQQFYGFSYVGPDGIEHTLGIDIVDSLREFWSRIERNLIVHKIKKDPNIGLTDFTVPVGPNPSTYKGLAALISQEDQQLVVATGTGAISEISATAGTWLIIQDFKISPIPGSSTTMTDVEVQDIEDRVLLTMFLRDPLTDVEVKKDLLAAETRDDLRAKLQALLAARGRESIREGRTARTYSQIFEERFKTVHEDSAAEKKEKNSVISLTFYSSQGSIVQAPGTTQLGSANDLTSFTTEVEPNMVTPISSFFTKTLDAARGSSPLLGFRKGESNDESKVMTHLVIRARFPTFERERRDREEGRHLGYFKLPISRDPLSDVNLPMLSSSEHPLERLATFRVGSMFDSLQASKVRKRLAILDPNILEGTVPPKVWEAASTRLMMVQKIISDSPENTPNLGPKYRQRFIVEVRSLLEYDEDFFNSPNVALRNTTQWNDPDRIVLALANCPEEFAQERLIAIIDELGERLVTDQYVEDNLAVSPSAFLGGHKLYPLNEDEIRKIRRDVAAHHLRFQEAYGDAFLEAISMTLDLGTYRAKDDDAYSAAPLRSLRDLVIFDRGGRALGAGPELQFAHDQFLLLREGGYKGKLFKPSLLTLEDLDDHSRTFIIRGEEILPQQE